MKFQERMIDISLRYPKTIMLVVILLFVGLAVQIPNIKVDTDPENMLPTDQETRVYHNKIKKDFTLYDMIVVGIVNEENPNGVFNPGSLERMHKLATEIQKIDGVIRQELLSLSSVDDISQGGPGIVRFEWLMGEVPSSQEEANEIREATERNPVLEGTLISEDRKAAAIYIPIRNKDEGHRISEEIKEIIAGFDGGDQYHITGLPVAEDTFGVEMFKQMFIAAPLAGLIIFLLMWFFFRSIALIISPMIVAIATVSTTMGLLIGLGFTVHIMSSMIPIFLMPIAVVDSVHILSEFAELYPHIKDRHVTITKVMHDLFKPMHYTSLTSAVGFASLALAPIPPVRVFGIFVAIGITFAFYLTITFIPAYVILLSDKRIEKLLRYKPEQRENHLLNRWLAKLGPRTLSSSKLIVAITVIIIVVSIVGISQIQINDNPVRWFRSSHPIRVADHILNKHFGGTYNAYLVLSKAEEPGRLNEIDEGIRNTLEEAKAAGGVNLLPSWEKLYDQVESMSLNEALNQLVDGIYDKLFEATDEEAEIWDGILTRLEKAQSEGKYFQMPEALDDIQRVQENLAKSDLVGKSNSIVDIVKTVHRELREGNPQYFTIPDNSNAVAQTLLSYQSSHRPQDLWHFLTPDYREANIWLQLKSGDNHDMLAVTRHLKEYLAKHPLPDDVTINWAGLTYLNVVWQEAMVSGMLNALLGSFIIVFIMMLVLFRSFWFGLLAMLPLSVTIAFIYGLIGLIGKDYDMPVAVLSSLTLGLSVDFAIHFLQRIREIHAQTNNWKKTIKQMFSEPALAISRNAIVIAIGFLPLLGSPLVPYNTVGFFLATIMAVSCLVTIILLPAVMDFFKDRLFAGAKAREDKESEAKPVSDV